MHVLKHGLKETIVCEEYLTCLVLLATLFSIFQHYHICKIGEVFRGIVIFSAISVVPDNTLTDKRMDHVCAHGEPLTILHSNL